MFSHSLVILLHPRLINEVKSHPHLSFDEATKRVSIACDIGVVSDFF